MTFIIAEIANAHQGSSETAAELAFSAVEAGADAVKFQIYFADELLSRDHPRYEHFKRMSFSEEAWEELLKKTRSTGTRVYCDVFGRRALEVAHQNQVSGFKIHSSDLCNIPLLKEAAQKKKEMLLAVGGSTLSEIAEAVNCILAVDPEARPTLLHGFQSFPTLVEHTKLSRLKTLQEVFGKRCDIGYMDHVAGEDLFGTSLPLMAIAMGARLIEKHITIDRAAQGIDYYSSLNPDEFQQFVQDIRRGEAALGEQPLEFSEEEDAYRDTMKKVWMLEKAIDSGERVEEENLSMKRAPGASSSIEYERLVGRSASRSIAAEKPLRAIDVSQRVGATVVARSASKRLANKALLDAAGMPALQHLLLRLKQAKTLDEIVLCTTTLEEDDHLAAIAEKLDIRVHRGPVEDVLDRVIGAVAGRELDVIVRVTGDDILVDPSYLDKAVEYHLANNLQYSDLKALPSGTEVEVFDRSLLETIWELAEDREGTEYLTFYIQRHAAQFRTGSVPVSDEHRRDWRLTLDTKEDYSVISVLLEAMKERGKAIDYNLDDIVEYFQSNPQLLEKNSEVGSGQSAPEVCVNFDWRKLLK